ncbi:hypothetical protein F441_20988 [Phytophthora nicotianae CJ01A1]|uniref:Uncharacterized protein n=1 Tax=Phytophthora nicotianae CJ01A1 TaxID=1317063 RepID=W2VVU3_PHYNI|nr:hypothetical protein F441_20988 [Phytophthora nicotianae CJ01A1]
MVCEGTDYNRVVGCGEIEGRCPFNTRQKYSSNKERDRVERHHSLCLMIKFVLVDDREQYNAAIYHHSPRAFFTVLLKPEVFAILEM